MAKVLIIGCGGREHALGYSIGLDPAVSEVLHAPGNGGTATGKARNVQIDCTKRENFPALAKLIEREHIDLCVVGPEVPLSLGIVDYLNAAGYNNAVGPTKLAAELETDKFFSFDIMAGLGLPQAEGVKCYSLEQVISAINERATERGIVVKARGLTGGKGVSMYDSREDALANIQNHVHAYGPENLVSERLFGEEFSVFGFSDGSHVIPVPFSVQDHKRLREGDRGPNTGGMGAYAPVPFAPQELVTSIVHSIMNPVVQEMRRQCREYRGALYAGMMMTSEGPQVLEFNVRLGDPEAQAMVPLLGSIYPALSLTLQNRLNEVQLIAKPGATCCVVLAVPGYPGHYITGKPISGLEEAAKVPGVIIFHAGTQRQGDAILTAGGRVLGVTAYAESGLADAVHRAYDAVRLIRAPGTFEFRSDIAHSALVGQNL